MATLNDTSKTAKINYITSRAMDIIRTRYSVHGSEVMKLIFVVLDVSFNRDHYTIIIKRQILYTNQYMKCIHSV